MLHAAPKGIDFYLIQLWPAPVEPAAILRVGSTNARYWHEAWGSNCGRPECRTDVDAPPEGGRRLPAHAALRARFCLNSHRCASLHGRLFRPTFYG